MRFWSKIAAALLIGLIPAFCHADTLTVSIISFDDDAEEDVTGPLAGDVRRSSSDLEIGNENGVYQWVGLRFQNIAIPPGSVINSATMRFTANETDVGVLIIPIFGEDSSDPEAFSDLAPLTTRSLTDAFVPWNIDPWFPADSGANTTTPNLAPIVQEIVDRADWVSGNPIAFLIENDPVDTSERIAVSFDGNPLQAAVLTIDFSPPQTGLPESITVIRGIHIGGTVADLHASDNVDYSIQRNPAQTSGVIEVEMNSVSSVASPTTFEFTLEASAFFRSTVIQSIRFFDYTAGVFVEVNAQNASRFTDSTVVAIGTGDLSRFVEPGTGNVVTRVLYTSIAPRQAFSASLDQAFWTIE
jgi:hypothetical protein